MLPQIASAYTTKTGIISADTTWPIGTYLVTGTVTVNSGKTLTIDAGAVVKFATTTQLTINGTLNAIGTSSPIYFTSQRDDSVGEDVDGNGPAPAAGQWTKIQCNSGSACNLTNTVVRYGGSGAGSQMIYTNGGVVTIIDSTLATSSSKIIYQQSGTTTVKTSILDNGAVGIDQDAGNAIFATTTIRNTTGYGIDAIGAGKTTIATSTFTNNTTGAGYFFLNSGLVLSSTANTATGNGRNGFTVENTLGTSQTWKGDIPYYFGSGLTIGAGKTLNLEEGVILKGASTSAITVSGILNANGEVELPIYFTSINDDSIGGDTGGNGASYGSAGNWRHIQVNAGGKATLNHSIVRYGGNSTGAQNANIYVNGGSLTLTNAEVATSTTYGIKIGSGSATTTFSLLHDQGYGLAVVGAGTATTSYSNIYNNSSYGMANTSGVSINAEFNWWGDESGPYNLVENPSGTGNAVSADVDFNPWTGLIHFTTGGGSVLFGEIRYEGDPGAYVAEWHKAIKTWNDEGPINIATSTGSTDLEVSVIDTLDPPWDKLAARWNAYPIVRDTIKLNAAKIGINSDGIQNTITHELGHALGLDHSFGGNIMYGTQTTQTTLGLQDISDIHYNWP